MAYRCRRPYWTPDEDRLLAERWHAGDTAAAAAAHLPGRTPLAVRVRAFTVGLKWNKDKIDAALARVSAWTDLETAWLAGFLDGEGCFTFFANGGRRPRPAITVTNTHRPALDRVAGMFGTGVWVQRNQKTGHRWATAYQTQVHQTDVLTLATRRLLPYLVIKGPAAALTLEYLDKRDALTPAERATFVERSRALNRRGPRPERCAVDGGAHAPPDPHAMAAHLMPPEATDANPDPPPR